MKETLRDCLARFLYMIAVLTLVVSIGYLMLAVKDVKSCKSGETYNEQTKECEGEKRVW